MKIRLFGFSAILLLLFCTACGTSDPQSADNPVQQIVEPIVEGGPCTYSKFDFSAAVTSISPFSTKDYSDNGMTRSDITNLFHVQLSFNKSSLSVEPQYLNELLGVNIDSTFLATHNISFGTEFTGHIEEIETGSCNPLMINFDHNF